MIRGVDFKPDFETVKAHLTGRAGVIYHTFGILSLPKMFISIIISAFQA
jgi:hypothetical protein